MLKKYDPEYYTNLINTRNVVHDEITRALIVVKEFIINKKLILSGGMAIDLALRLKGDNIYTDEQIPDYDFYSTNHATDAYELGSILCKAGFKNISCINAMHITTMKVRVDFETVADITYCPLTVFRQIPTLNYDKLRIVHPHWQMSDQHSSLSLPFENPGMEVIFHRWKKDMLRYDKLYEHYPIVPEMEQPDSITTGTKNIKKYTTENSTDDSNRPPYGRKFGYHRSSEREHIAKTLELPMQTVKIPMAEISGSCICGWSAIDYEIDGDNITLSIPTDEPVTVASYNYNQFIEKHELDVLEYYSEYFGKLPRKVICKSTFVDTNGRTKKLEVYDIFGILISANQISEKHDVWVCNIQWVMLYLLVRIFSSGDPKIIFTSEEQYVRCRQLVTSGEYPSIDVYGEHNFTHTSINSMKKHKEKVYSIKSKQLQPVSMYPKHPICTNDKTFDSETSEYFMTDARRLESFITWEMDPYPEYNTKSSKESIVKYES
jgi:hypothetical protein